jgi:hypothetical protein
MGRQGNARLGAGPALLQMGSRDDFSQSTFSLDIPNSSNYPTALQHDIVASNRKETSLEQVLFHERTEFLMSRALRQLQFVSFHMQNL